MSNEKKGEDILFILRNTVDMWTKTTRLDRGSEQSNPAKVVAYYEEDTKIPFKDRGELHFDQSARVDDINNTLNVGPDYLHVSYKTPVPIEDTIQKMTLSLQAHLQIALKAGKVDGIEINPTQFEDGRFDHERALQLANSFNLASHTRNPQVGMLRASWEMGDGESMFQKLIWFGPDYVNSTEGNEFKFYVASNRPELARFVTHLALAGFPIPPGAPQDEIK